MRIYQKLLVIAFVLLAQVACAEETAHIAPWDDPEWDAGGWKGEKGWSDYTDSEGNQWVVYTDTDGCVFEIQWEGEY